MIPAGDFSKGRDFAGPVPLLRQPAHDDRRDGWDYDADGRLVSRNEAPPNGLTFVPARYAYDAAGRRALTTQTTSRPNGNPNSQTVLTTALTLSETYDGDGRGVRRATTKQVNSNAPTTTTLYYLRSTALGGRTISEYNSAGARQTAYAWAGGEVVARQEAADTSQPRLRWEAMNPVTGDGVEADADGKVMGATRLDPSGVDAGEADPFGGGAGDPSAGAGDTSIARMAAKLMGDYFDLKCRVDGQLVGCAVAESLAAAGAVDACPDNDCGPRAVTVIARGRDGRVLGSSSYLVRQGQAGWDGSLDGTYRVVGRGALSFGAIASNMSGFLGALGGLDARGFGEFGDAALRRVSGGDAFSYAEVASLRKGLPDSRPAYAPQGNSGLAYANKGEKLSDCVK